MKIDADFEENFWKDFFSNGPRFDRGAGGDHEKAAQLAREKACQIADVNLVQNQDFDWRKI